MKKDLLQAFQNDKFGNVRVVLVGANQQPYFVGKDVAECLGYSDLTHCITDHVDEEDRVNSKTQGHFNPEFGQRGTWLINESGLYSLVLSSKLPSAKEFKRWVTSEVLPSIRKHGSYMTDNVLEQAIENPDFAIGLLTKLKEEKEARKNLELENAQQKQIIGELQPKATYYDLILQSNQLMPISLIAKDYGMGAQTLNKKLHDLGVQYNQSGTWLLYAKYQDKGYTQSKTQSYPKSDGNIGTKLHTQWTQKGRLFIYELLKQQGVLPTIEREENAEWELI